MNRDASDGIANEASPASVFEAELLAHHTWPCAAEKRMGEWILRASDGFTRRANSALAIGSPAPCLDAALEHLASWSHQHGIEPCVKITPLAERSLDAALQSRGWAVATPALVLKADLRCAPPESPPESLGMENASSREWLEALFDWDGTSEDNAFRHRAILARMPSPLFASWREQGALVAVAAIVPIGDAAHLYDLVVDPAHRGRGIGGRFLRAILPQLRRARIQNAFLQVLDANTTAKSLYDATGFVLSHRYHYRIAPPT